MIEIKKQLSLIKETNKNFLDVILKLQTDIMELNNCYNDIEHDSEFKTNNLFSDRFTMKLNKYFNNINMDLNCLYDETNGALLKDTLLPGLNNTQDFLKIIVYVETLLNTLKKTLFWFRLRMTSTNKYFNTNNPYYKSFPLTKYDNTESLLLSVEYNLIENMESVLDG